MIRLASWIVGSLVLTALAAWLISLPGTLTLEAAGYRMQPRLGTAVFMFILVAVVVIGLWAILRRIISAPRNMARRRSERRREQGVEALSDAIVDLPGSTLVSAMTRNGKEFGIRVSGLGHRWFTAPCNRIHGICFDGYEETDGNPDLGDSSITETAGIGAFAMAASPAIARYIGGTSGELLQHTLEMYRITVGEHPDLRIPALDYRGVPTGIDVRRVVETGITPIINTSIAHREPGIGQIGAGRTRAPLACFTAAFEALSRQLI